MSGKLGFFVGLYHKCVRVHSSVVDLVGLLTGKALKGQRSYYPEYQDQTKGRARIALEQFCNFLECGSVNYHYCHYGLDIRGFRNRRDFIDNETFFYRRNFIRDRSGCANHAFVLRDKLCFYTYLRTLGFPTPEIVGVCDGDLFRSLNGEACPLGEYLRQTGFIGFIKPIDGQCGNSVHKIGLNESGHLMLDEKTADDGQISTALGIGKYVVQAAITNQHPALNALHPHAINTVRLATVYNGKTKQYDVWPPILRIGTGTSCVDNTSAGGLAVGIDLDTRRLRKYGFYKPATGGKVEAHPNTGIVFDGYEIPFLWHAVEMARRLHASMDSLHSIGWDIAITTDGPVFIEGNDNWEITSIQACHGGLRKEFKKYFYDYLKI